MSCKIVILSTKRLRILSNIITNWFIALFEFSKYYTYITSLIRDFESKKRPTDTKNFLYQASTGYVCNEQQYNTKIPNYFNRPLSICTYASSSREDITQQLKRRREHHITTTILEQTDGPPTLGQWDVTTQPYCKCIR